MNMAYVLSRTVNPFMSWPSLLYRGTTPTEVSDSMCAWQLQPSDGAVILMSRPCPRGLYSSTSAEVSMMTILLQRGVRP